jgi:hypothetical protein
VTSVRVRERGNLAEVDGTDVLGVLAELAPGGERIADTPQAKRAGKIVAAAAGYYQYWQMQLYQLPEVAMHSAISAKNQDDIGLTGVGRNARRPGDVRVVLEGDEIMCRGTQAKNGRGAHFFAARE